MIDSAARAERFDPAPSISPFYTWEVPQKPVLVRLPLLLIDRLEREAVENFRSVSSRGSEIGGVLWGSVEREPEPGEPTALSVAEYDLVPCDYTLGPLYRLSETDLARVDRALSQRGGSGLRPLSGGAMLAAGGAPPVEPGSLSVDVSVTLTVEIAE